MSATTSRSVSAYNFGRFSDDLREQRYKDRGMFVNFIGKF